MLHHALYTLETAGWRALLGQSCFLLQHHLPADVEDYLVGLLVKASNSSILDNCKKPDRSLNELAEHCLLVSGLFPEQSMRHQLPLSYFVDAGRDSYLELGRLHKDSELYLYIGEQFVPVMDVLQQFRELCTGDQIFDPIQAYDIWHETGSVYARHLLNASSDGFPVSQQVWQVH